MPKDRIGIDDRWHKRIKGPDGTTRTERSAVYGKVTRWRVRWVIDGREHAKVFHRKPDAQALVNKITADIHNGRLRAPAPDALETVARKWIATKSHRAPKTLAGYNCLLDTLILPRWGDTPIGEVDFEGYSSWLAGLSVDGSQRGTPLSASRIIQAHQLVGAVLKYAQRTGRIDHNVALEIKRSEDLPSPVPRERRYLSHRELLTLAANCGRFEPLTLVLGYCGLRFGEAVALRRRHVGDRELTVLASVTPIPGRGVVESPTKTRRTRHVPIPEPVFCALSATLSDENDSLVFPSQRGGFLRLEEYRRAFRRACAEVGIEWLVPHGLRHTAASLAISAGANVKVVQRMLGHASAAMTLDLYGHLFDDDLAGVRDALGRAIEQTRYGIVAESDKDRPKTDLPDGAN